MSPYPIREPEFCPRQTCRYYHRSRAAEGGWFIRYGSYFTRSRGKVHRFRCRFCGRTCSTQTFSIDYWTHSSEDYQLLLKSVCSCSGLRQHARFIDVSFRVVENRIRRLARNCLAVLDAAGRHLSLEEDLVLDGFESYTRSQYFPNNISILVGYRSQYIYGAVHTLLRRKGRMSDLQRARRQLIDSCWRPKVQGVRDDCAALLQDHAGLMAEAARRGTVTLWSDEHSGYDPALRRVRGIEAAMRERRIVHRTVSSRAARRRENPLFSVNYVDRQLRKNLGEHVRETVKQGREVNCQMERMAIFCVAHNYLTPHRIGDGVRLHSGQTHAWEAGVKYSEWDLGVTRLYTHRSLWGQSLNRYEWQRRIWGHEYENPPAVKLVRGKIRTRAVALPPGGIARHFLE